jgi:hypothetical protein
MKNETLYHRTVDILVQAYFNDTLEHDNCYACAVGNIVAANCGFVFEKDMRDEENRLMWKGFNGYGVIKLSIDDNATYFAIEYRSGNDVSMTPNIKHQIEKSGYSLRELSKIEKAFERASIGNSKEDWMFNGLMAVIEVLDQIHENNDTEISQSSKSKFTRNSLTPIIH